MIEIVKEIICESTGVPKAELLSETRLDQYTDELDLQEIVICLEDWFHADAPRNLVSSMRTVGDVVDLANALLWRRIQHHLSKRLGEMSASFIIDRVKSTALNNDHFIVYAQDEFWQHVIQSRCDYIINDALTEPMSVNAHLVVRCEHSLV